MRKEGRLEVKEVAPSHEMDKKGAVEEERVSRRDKESKLVVKFVRLMPIN